MIGIFLMCCCCMSLLGLFLYRRWSPATILSLLSIGMSNVIVHNKAAARKLLKYHREADLKKTVLQDPGRRERIAAFKVVDERNKQHITEQSQRNHARQFTAAHESLQQVERDHKLRQSTAGHVPPTHALMLCARSPRYIEVRGEKCRNPNYLPAYLVDRIVEQQEIAAEKENAVAQRRAASAFPRGMVPMDCETKERTAAFLRLRVDELTGTLSHFSLANESVTSIRRKREIEKRLRDAEEALRSLSHPTVFVPHHNIIVFPGQFTQKVR